MKHELWRRVRSFSDMVGTRGFTSGAIALPLMDKTGRSSVRLVDSLLSHHKPYESVSPGLAIPRIDLQNDRQKGKQRRWKVIN